MPNSFMNKRSSKIYQNYDGTSKEDESCLFKQKKYLFKSLVITYLSKKYQFKSKSSKYF